jgi:hypothetical protein
MLEEKKPLQTIDLYGDNNKKCKELTMQIANIAGVIHDTENCLRRQA